MSSLNRLRGIQTRENMRENVGDMGNVSRMNRPENPHQAGSWQAQRLRSIAQKNAMTDSTTRALTNSRRLDQTDAQMQQQRIRDAAAQALAQRGMNLRESQFNRSGKQWQDQFDRQGKNDEFRQGMATDQFNRSGKQWQDQFDRQGKNDEFRQGMATDQFSRIKENDKFSQGMATDQFNRRGKWRQDDIARQDKMTDEQRKIQAAREKRAFIADLQNKYDSDDVAKIVKNPRLFNQLYNPGSGEEVSPDSNILPGEYRPKRAFLEHLMKTQGPQKANAIIQNPEIFEKAFQQEMNKPGGPDVPGMQRIRLRPRGYKAASASASSFDKNMDMVGTEISSSLNIPESQLYDENGKPTPKLRAVAQYMDRGMPIDQAAKRAGLMTQDESEANEIERLRRENIKEQGQVDPRFWTDESDEFHERYKRIKAYDERIKRAKTVKAKEANKGIDGSGEYKTDEWEPTQRSQAASSLALNIKSPKDQEDFDKAKTRVLKLIKNKESNGALLNGIYKGISGKDLTDVLGDDYLKEYLQEFSKKIKMQVTPSTQANVKRYYDKANGEGAYDKAFYNHIFKIDSDKDSWTNKYVEGVVGGKSKKPGTEIMMEEIKKLLPERSFSDFSTKLRNLRKKSK